MVIKPHPKFAKEYDSANEMDDFLDGEISVISARYLTRMDSEDGQSPYAIRAYQRRQKMLDYFNHCKYVSDIHLGALNQPMVFQGMEGERWESIIDDVTGFEDSAEGAARELLEFYVAHGRCGVLVDAPTEVAKTEQERTALGQRTYQVLFRSQDIRDWGVFIDGPMRGMLSKVTFALPPAIKEGEHYDMQRRIYIEEQGQDYKWQTLRAKDSGEFNPRGTDEYEVVEEGDGGINEIPFVIIGKGYKESALKDVQATSKNRLNKKSAHDNILFHQGFKRTILAGAEQEEIMALAENTLAVISNEGAKVLDLGESDAKATAEDVARLDRMAFRVGLRQRHLIADDSRQTQSAESKSKDSDSLNDFYDKTLDMFESKLTKVYQLHAKYEGLDEDISVAFARRYKSEDGEREMIERQVVYAQARELGALTVQKEILKLGISKLRVLPAEGLTDDERREELLAEVDTISGGGEEQAGGRFSAANLVGLDE